MSIRSFASGLIAGVAMFLVFGVIGTAYAPASVPFDLAVGLPLGLIAGASTAWIIIRVGGEDRTQLAAQLAEGSIIFGAVFLITWFGIGLFTEFSRDLVLLGAIVAALLSFIGTMAKYRF